MNNLQNEQKREIIAGYIKWCSRNRRSTREVKTLEEYLDSLRLKNYSNKFLKTISLVLSRYIKMDNDIKISKLESIKNNKRHSDKINPRNKVLNMLFTELTEACGIRADDIFKLRVCDFNSNSVLVDKRKYPISNELSISIENYIRDLNLSNDDYIIKSHHSKYSGEQIKAISTHFMNEVYGGNNN